MEFDDFGDQVEARPIETRNWTDIQVADFVSPRIGVPIHAYKKEVSVNNAAYIVLKAPASVQHFE